MLEEAATLVKYRTGLKVGAEVDRCRNKRMDWGGLVLLPGPPFAPLTPPPRYICLSDGGGGGVDTWYPSCTPNFSVYVCPGGHWIKMVTRTLLDYVDNLSLFLVMDE